MTLPHRLLVFFASEHFDFRFAELQALLDLHGVRSQRCDSKHISSPFGIFETDSVEQFCAAASRSVLVKSILEFWGESASINELAKQIQLLPSSFVRAPFEKPGVTFKVTVTGNNKRLSSQHQLKRIEFLTENSLEWMKTTKVRLKDPEVELVLYEEYPGTLVFDDETCGSAPVHNYAMSTNKRAKPDETNEQEDNATSSPLCFYFGRLLSAGMRTTLYRYALSDRYFIGSTTLDPCLAALMVNLAQVERDFVVYDPFVGTGSILVAAAHCGALVLGSDIDAALLYARCKNTRAHLKLRRRDESIRRNLVQYGLTDRYVDVLVADASVNSRLWRTPEAGCLYDAIVTDPPYGIRESATRSNDPHETECGMKQSDESDKGDRKNRAPQYALDELFCDLVEFGASRLRVGGRLVFWIPVHKPTYTPACVPQHPSFRLVANCEHPLFRNVARRLVIMEKTKHSDMQERTSIADREYYRTFRDSYFQIETDAT